MSTLTTVARATLDPTRGHVLVRVIDCGGLNATAVGATVTADTEDAMSTRFYARGAVPDLGATSTLVGGLAGYFNLPAGDVGAEVATEMRVDETATSTRSGAASIFIRAGWLHQVFIDPDPS